MAVVLLHVMNDQAAQQGTRDEQDGHAHQKPHPCRTLALALLGLGLFDAVELIQFDILKFVLEVAHVVIDMRLVCWREAVRLGVGQTSSGRLLH